MTDQQTSPAERRAEALRRAAATRTDRAVNAAERGIRALIKDGGQISYAAVARAAGVSAKFLKMHPDLSQRIRTLRDQQRGAAESAVENYTLGESSVISALRRRIREQDAKHRAEIAALRARIKLQDRQIAALYGMQQGR